jgi:hypothetical protein
VSGVSSANRAKGRQVLAELLQDDSWKEWFVDRLVEGWTEDKKVLAGDRAKASNLSERGNAAKKKLFTDPN